jgi:hypothetical protein
MLGKGSARLAALKAMPVLAGALLYTELYDDLHA